MKILLSLTLFGKLAIFALEIWQLNRERIANPHLIYPDYVLSMS